MKIVIMEFKQKYYRLSFNNDYGLWALGMFLTTDVSDDLNFEQWAKNPLKNQYGGNISHLEKIDMNVLLYLGFDYDRYEANPSKYSLTIALDQFIYILEKWHKFVIIGNPYIMITEENNKYTIAAFDKNPAPEIVDK